MSIKIQCVTEKLIVITIKLDYSKVPSKSTVPTYVVEMIRVISSSFRQMPTILKESRHFREG